MFKEKGIEYLALPYTHSNKAVMELRAMVSDFIAAELFKAGRIVYAPISSWHHVAIKYDLPQDFETWKELDKQFIKKCSKLLIITLSGWAESKGVNEEIALARKYNKPIVYLDPYSFINNDLKEKDEWQLILDLLFRA